MSDDFRHREEKTAAKITNTLAQVDLNRSPTVGPLHAHSLSACVNRRYAIQNNTLSLSNRERIEKENTMKYQDVKAMFQPNQLKLLVANGTLKGVTVADAKEIGFSENEIQALVTAKKVLAPREKKVARIQVSEKGALAVYGLGRFPVTLYKDQWEILLDSSDLIRNAIAANAASLASKPTV